MTLPRGCDLCGASKTRGWCLICRKNYCDNCRHDHEPLDKAIAFHNQQIDAAELHRRAELVRQGINPDTGQPL